jgi:hypothetical protein
LLTETNWIIGQSGGDWMINPRVHQLFREQAELERQQRDPGMQRFATSRERLAEEYGES